MSLYDCYSYIYANPCLWKYYDWMSFDYPFNITPDFDKQFIKAFLKSGEKGDMPLVNNLSKIRLNHTLSAYFLGLYLFYGLELKDLFQASHGGSPGFIYYWFLLCLCHDFGYVKETALLNKAKKVENNPGSIESAIRAIFDNNKDAIPHSIIERVPYSPRLIEDYNHYVQEEYGHMEHGTEGAIDLFNGLQKHHNDIVIHYGPAGATHFVFNNVRISKESVSRFAEISALVAIHNIWLANDPTTKGLYENFSKGDLNALVGSKYYIGSDAILFWVLELSDSIEPLKRCAELGNHKNILDAISISARRHGEICSIDLKYERSNLCSSFLNTWIHGIEDMNNWIDDMTVERNDKTNSVKICFIIKTV